jgi:hypothetical protein
MADLGSWRSKHRELIFACRVIGDRFGPGAVDAVAAEHMKNVREAFRQKAEETGRNDLAVLVEGFQKITETHEHEILRQDDRVLEIRVTRCAHAEMFADYCARDIGLKFMCAGDMAMIEGLNPKITLERPKLLMAGDDCCHFIYRLED